MSAPNYLDGAIRSRLVTTSLFAFAPGELGFVDQVARPPIAWIAETLFWFER